MHVLVIKNNCASAEEKQQQRQRQQIRQLVEQQHRHDDDDDDVVNDNDNNDDNVVNFVVGRGGLQAKEAINLIETEQFNNYRQCNEYNNNNNNNNNNKKNNNKYNMPTTTRSTIEKLLLTKNKEGVVEVEEKERLSSQSNNSNNNWRCRHYGRRRRRLQHCMEQEKLVEVKDEEVKQNDTELEKYEVVEAKAERNLQQKECECFGCGAKSVDIMNNCSSSSNSSSSRRQRRRQSRTQRQANNYNHHNSNNNDNDNCNYSYNFNNKFLLITCMLLITMTATTMTICQAAATPLLNGGTMTAAATTSRTLSASAAAAAASPLSALLKSGGATYLRTASSSQSSSSPTSMQKRQLQQQQQLFAMLSKNTPIGGNGDEGAGGRGIKSVTLNGGIGGVAAAASSVGATSGRHFLMLRADDDDDEEDDDVDAKEAAHNNHARYYRQQLHHLHQQSHNADVGVDGNGDGDASEEEDDDITADVETERILAARVPTELRNLQRRLDSNNNNNTNTNNHNSNVAVPPPIPIASLETTGFVADDGQQYEKAEKVLKSSSAAAVDAESHVVGGGEQQQQSNVNCPKECKCLNVFFDCGKLHLDHVPELPNYVQNLDLMGNKLNDTGVLVIQNLPELHKLSLKRNQLDVMPKFVGLTALKQLNLANNRIRRISSEAIAALPKLKLLDLSRNNLLAVEAHWFPKANRLGHLILNANEISFVDEHGFENLNDLLDLEMNSNRLINLPGGVFKNLGKLKKLSLNSNHLEINWSTFRGLLSLQKLFLKSNNIRALQDGVFHVMHNIESIELDHNGITSLSRQGLFNLTKLSHLSLSNNSITRFELDTWEFTQSLETLDLSRNNISEFKPQHLDCLQRLKHLNLGHNKIQYLMDNTFDCVKNLEVLNLRRNRLAWVIEDPNAAPPFKALRKLRKLDLYGNNLKQINSKSLNGLNNLELLNLGGNALATIQVGAFEHMTHLQKLIFKSLNFICDCELLWFRRFLQTRFAASANMQANVICGHPEHLLDRELQSLNTADLACADSPKPVLKQEPNNLLAVKGANITMECIANSPTAASLAAADELKIKWRHDNQNVRERPAATAHGAYSATETQVHHDQSTNQTTIIGYLRLYNVSYESAGRYQCVVSNAFGTTYSQRFKISIGIHPTFLQIPSNVTIDAGETARLVCSASGDPVPEIALQKFGASDFPAATERRLQVIREENAFLITNAKPSDTGIYTCTADSAAGEIKINATLVVNDKPQIPIPLVLKESEIGANTILECLNEEATAELVQPHREWYKENKPFHISATSSYSERFYFTTDKELLVIVNTQIHDAGHYRCEITDKSKTLTLQSELVVVHDTFNQNLIIHGVVMVTIACVLLGSCIIWSILCYQKRKLDLSNQQQQQQQQRSLGGGSLNRIVVAAASQHNILSGSRGSALDQTHLTTLNRTYLRPAQQHQQIKQQSQHDMRPRSLADLDLNQEQRSRLIITHTPNFQQRLAEEGCADDINAMCGGGALTLAYLQNNDLEHQLDHLSSKDSGTGSDAAVKRSLEDFSITALLPATTAESTPNATMAGRQKRRRAPQAELDLDVDCDDHRNGDGDEHAQDDDDDDNDLQFASTRALGISQYDMELSDISRGSASEQERFLQNNNHRSHNYDGDVEAMDIDGIVRGRKSLLKLGIPRKCSTQISTNKYSNVVSPTSTTVDI